MKSNRDQVAELYALAASGDFSAYLQLCDIYAGWISETIRSLKERYHGNASDENLKIVAFAAIGASLKKIELNRDCPGYADWIEKNIRVAVQQQIFTAKGLTPPDPEAQ